MTAKLVTTAFVMLLAIGSLIYSHSQTENPFENEFLEWKKQFGIGESFTYVENLYRMKVFQQNMEKIH